MALNKEQRTYLANNGVITEGITVARPNKSTTVFDWLFFRSPSRTVHYDFKTNNTESISGKTSLDLVAAPNIYFSIEGKSVKIIYDPNNPELNDLYFPIFYDKLKKE